MLFPSLFVRSLLSVVWNLKILLLNDTEYLSVWNDATRTNIDATCQVTTGVWKSGKRESGIRKYERG